MRYLTVDLLCSRMGVWEIFDVMRLFSTVSHCSVWKIEIGTSNCHISIRQRSGPETDKCLNSLGHYKLISGLIDAN